MLEKQLIIESVNEDGRKFRPSDWIERISAVMGSFGSDHRLHYNKSVQPKMVNGEKCLVVDSCLEQEDPAGYRYIIKFAEENQLRVYRQ